MKDFHKQLRKISKPLLGGFQLVVIPSLLFVIFLIVYSIHNSLAREISRFDVSSFSDTAPLAAYPILTYPYSPFLTAQSAVVMDDASKVLVYEKNPGIRFSMASTTKIMTALVALEQFSLNDPLIVYSDTIEGSTIGLRKGERYTLDSLLYAMLLPSANDAAEAIAANYPGGRGAFIKRMNAKALEMELVDTQYYDPAGLEDDGNFTTASDLAKLSSAAIRNETIARIVGTRQKVISDVSGVHVLALENLNELLGTNGVIGIKTGYTQGAGGVLATARKENGHLQIIVVMKSADRFGDTSALLRLVANNITYFKPAYSPISMQFLTP